ncbi:MAG TPA: YdeI/OmpD-associated family protein [Cyclobacteriaceae bacterium]|nr:YdeI/OmpD-associated family protein [Cyclobacteriaceae bacterium]
MIRFTAPIQIDSRDPEKKGWSFIIINKTLSNKLNPGVRKGFRVKGKLDSYQIKQTSLLPVNGEQFMLPINATMRKGTGKKAGDKLTVELELDKAPPKLSADLLACLQDEPVAYEYFGKLPPSHKRYFSNWIEGAKTDATKTKRIAMALSALGRKMHFGLMIREEHARRKSL